MFTDLYAFGHLSRSADLDSSGPEGPECWVAERPVGAGFAAHARVYHHHRPLYQRPRQAAEGHHSSAGLVRDTAARVGASTAVAQPVDLGADAALVKQPDGAGRGGAGLALPLLSCLGTHKHGQVRAAPKRDGQGQRSKWKANTTVTPAGEGQMRAHHRFGGWLNSVARPHFAKSCFHLQLAGWVLVGNPCGDPGPTALGTGTPLGALLWAGGARRD